MSFLVSHMIFWAAAIACVVAQGAIVRSVLIGGRAGDGLPTEERRTAPRPAGVTAARRPAELVWALAPALALAAVLVLTWRALPSSP